MSSWGGADDARRLAQIIFVTPGTVAEIRGLEIDGRAGAVASAYCDSIDSFVQVAWKLDGRASGVYFTLNPVEPSLLARAANRVVSAPKSTTTDKEIPRRVRLVIDLDPVRPSGISSSDPEREAAFAMAKQVVEFLTANGFPEPAKADSGNGAHVLYAIDLPPDDGGLVEEFLRALAFRFDTDAIKVDQTVYNPARICKLYGTLARKGDSTADRPHRRSRLISVPDVMEVVPLERLQAIAAMAPPKAPKSSAPGFNGTRIDVDAMLRAAGITVAKVKPWQGGTCWVLEVCPWNPEHRDGCASVMQFAGGAVAAKCHHNSCADKGWHELRDIVDPGWRERSSGGFGNRGSGAFAREQAGSGGSGKWGQEGFVHTNAPWPDPQPIPDELPPVEPFDPRQLPGCFWAWVTDIADRMQCPPDYSSVAVMVSLAAIIGRKIGIRPKRYDDWTVVPNLWGGGIGRPSLMKTPAMQEPLKAIKRLEIAAKKRFEAEMLAHMAEQMVDKERRRQASSDVRDALKNGDENAVEIATAAMKQGTDLPLRRRYLVNDSTVEKLGEILNQNPNGVLVYRDELVGLLKGLDKEGQEGARSFYLEAWNGTGRYTYDRIARGTIDIDAAIVSVLGAIQPGPLHAYLNEAINQSSGDDGLMQRFQLLVWPDANGPWRNVDRWPDTDARTEAFQVFERLDNLNVDEVGAERDQFDEDQIPFLRFSPSAQDKFDAWRERLERRLRSNEDHPAIESHLAKYRSLLPSIALVIHLADGGTGPVGDAAIDKALWWVEYLESHARRVYSVVTRRDAMAARALARKIQKGEVENGFTAREVYRRGWALLGSKEDVALATEMLVELGWLREVRTPAENPHGSGGAPTTKFQINPKVRPTPPDKTDGTPADDVGEV